MLLLPILLLYILSNLALPPRRMPVRVQEDGGRQQSVGEKGFGQGAEAIVEGRRRFEADSRVVLEPIVDGGLCNVNGS